ncbi:MAG: CHAP domain-containing protein [Acutalibacteraceae bacterium]|nr:CHAP domain-containing protein [Acutalibacteraceae bacterium]
MSDAKKFAEHALKYVGYACNHFINTMAGYGATYGDAWCAWFTSTIAKECKFTDIIPMTGGAGCFARQGVPNKMGTWYEGHNTKPKVGDIITFSWNGIGGYENCGQDKYYSDHVGIVYKVDDKYVYTVEGNANGSNTGSTVCTKTWNLYSGKINGYYRPNWKNVNEESEDEEMNFRKGDKSDGVLAYKSMLITAKTLGLITQSVNADNVFGDGTLKATKQVQEKYKLEVDGIAGVKTITALHNAISEAIAGVRKCDRNSVLLEAKSAMTNAVDKLKV